MGASFREMVTIWTQSFPETLQVDRRIASAPASPIRELHPLDQAAPRQLACLDPVLA